MTKELIQSRLQQLEAQRDQAVANANALNGAIQECQFWMAALDKIEAQTAIQDSLPKEN